ncbi:MAG: hypothetical protein VX569_13105 [Pseudomonadota bacterium]|nr:hypothetical protein [Pseudomonadota bacterium]
MSSRPIRWPRGFDQASREARRTPCQDIVMNNIGRSLLAYSVVVPATTSPDIKYLQYNGPTRFEFWFPARTMASLNSRLLRLCHAP